jgi:hypothetical protein
MLLGLESAFNPQFGLMKFYHGHRGIHGRHHEGVARSKQLPFMAEPAQG